QLRSRSRGETSGTALDCMRHGLPLIVNAHGSMAELPRDAVHLLADVFEDRDLVAALELMRNDARHRADLGGRAAAFVRQHHDPVRIAARYAAAIEAFAALPRTGLVRLPEALAGSGQGEHDRAADRAIAACAALSVRPAIAARQLFVDITAMVGEDLRTGIQRVARALLEELLARPPAGFRIEPVYASGSGFRYARRFTLGFLGAKSNALSDAAIEPRSGDIYFMPDLAHESVIRNRGTYRALRDHGVSVNFLVHDLLPVQFPDYFPSYAAPLHTQWLEVIAEADRAIGVSRSVAKDLEAWCRASDTPHNPHLQIVYSHHGADLAASKPTTGLPGGADGTLQLLKSATSFLMVGTVEPRKGHAQVLDAFELLWAAGRDEALVVVGKPGWMVKPLVKRLAHHAERNRRLFWIENASDEYLARIYESSACLIAASYGEGFGLPLIEAATYGLPIIARDIPVFREVAGEHAYFFEAASADELAAAIEAWTRLNRNGQAPQSRSMPRLTWAESAENLKRLLLGRNG
ncbi:MAG: glycosyltransferase family 1 protein, partial [Mesorhizobium sp.]|nr:glycosyltransferase family 1 protein [Mesorhizobium sp.]